MRFAEARMRQRDCVRRVRHVRREVLEMPQLEIRCTKQALREDARARTREGRRGVDQTRPSGGPPLDLGQGLGPLLPNAAVR
eukprot:10333967-Lingulodinium_polyedra.AAC.1